MSEIKKKELSVEVTAAQLGVTERSVVNYLKTRRIEGIKVGKKWFIDSASVDAFAQRYGFTPKAVPQANAKQTEQAAAQTGINDAARPALLGRMTHSSLSQLHLFKLCVEVF